MPSPCLESSATAQARAASVPTQIFTLDLALQLGVYDLCYCTAECTNLDDFYPVGVVDLRERVGLAQGKLVLLMPSLTRSPRLHKIPR